MFEQPEKRWSSAAKAIGDPAMSEATELGSRSSRTASGSPAYGMQKRTWGYYVFRKGLRMLLRPEHEQQILLSGIRDAVVLPTGQRKVL